MSLPKGLKEGGNMLEELRERIRDCSEKLGQLGRYL